ncbi:MULTISPECIES: M48 family metallopeptidase [Paraburkholderia]|uniref:M48 family metalloprotease n=1 Tax=Paraburkholderia caribensis TaxID=75105 RepID=A0ABV0DUW1_9BURK|nr:MULTISPECIES: M48 family metallopeptidase [Paraburkholderia]AMV41116.1 peptidase M48 [Paraburkholderia caribensis]AUT50434.1 peptidase M48 [Paraburkholderia caribensis]MCO4875940.1 M48 family metalloprotease [Paraburkholderia caribensis]PTB29557.1 peptidase M48 [Paraburkholderia caribensis]CAG9230254.1 Peptidase M48 [Paraburkholderia caribensis]
MVFASRRAVMGPASRAAFRRSPAYRMRARSHVLHLAVLAACAAFGVMSPWQARAAESTSSVSAPPAANAPSTPSTLSAPKSETAPSATSGTSAPSNAGAATPPTPVTARTPAPTPPPPPFVPNQQLRYGGYAVFRNLIPSPMLEAQSAEEFDQIARGAEHMSRLYPSSDAHVKRVQSIVDKLVPYALKWNDRAKNWKWDIAVLRSPDVRVYCLPGGKIIVYGGMLDKIKPNDNELGMLLGHEIAHALREHARERLGEQQAAQLGSGSIPQLFGLADLGEAPLGIGTQLLEMKYERADETEADVIGSEIASRAGFDPRAAITLWDKLAVATRSNRDQGFIYVHPYNPTRRADIMKRLPDMLPLYAKAVGKSVDALPDYAGIGRPRRTTASD